MYEFQKVIKIGCLVFTALILLAGPGLAQNTPVKSDCPSEVTYTLPPEAQVVSFTCEVKNYQKEFPSIHYTVAIKNVSNEPKRFRVNIFLPDGKAVGGLMPIKGNPPVVQPGEEVKDEYPVKGFVDHPKTLDVLVKVLAD